MIISVTTQTTLMATSITDSTAAFNNTVQMNYPTGQRFTYNNKIYQNAGVAYTPQTWSSSNTYHDGDMVFRDGLVKRVYLSNGIISYVTVVDPKDLTGFAYIEPTNQYKPFDGKNYTKITGAGTITYTIKSLEKFDTLAVGSVKASYITATFKNPAGETVNTVEHLIDGRRDTESNLSLYPKTEIFYATAPIDANGTVEISIVGDAIECGTLMLGMSVSAGFTNLELQNSFIDYSTYTEDEWGNIDYTQKAKISVFKGSADILITDYDMTDRLLTSIGGQIVIFNGSDAKNITPDSISVFSSTRKIGRLFDISQQTKTKNGGIDQTATYSFTLKEVV